MKVCGFSFVRNGVKYDYPFVEAIKSILPICDKVVVAVGNSDDDTVSIVRAIDPKVEVIETVWDDSLREGGRVLAVETDKAFQAISSEYDWAFYIQGDEVIHEQYLPIVQDAMKRYLQDQTVEGLLFHYKHFFGSYEFVGQQYSWYRREIRVVKNRKDIFSYHDAQGFRKKPNDKLSVKLIDAYMYHYGYVREPKALQQKENAKIRMYQSDGWIQRYFSKTERYQYEDLREPLMKFTGTHPKVMQERIKKLNWTFEPDLSIQYSSMKDRFKRIVGKLTGWYPGEYKNYRLLR